MIAGLSLPNPIDIVTAPFRWGADQLKSAGADLVREAFQWIVGLLLSGVSWMFQTAFEFISESTTPDLYANWFSGSNGPYQMVMLLATSMLMLVVMLAVAEAIWNRDGAMFVRSLVQDLPKAVFWLTSLLFIVTLMLALADAITHWFMDLFADETKNFSQALANVAGELQFGAGLFVVILLAFAMIPVLLFVAFMLVFREGFILFLVLMVAVAMSVDMHRPLRGTSARAWRLLGGVIAAKPVIAICFALGGSAMGAINSEAEDTEAVPEPGTTETAVGEEEAEEILGEDSSDLAPTVGVLLAGMATCMLGAVAPFAVLRMFPVGEAAAAQEGQSAVTGKAKSAAVRTASVVGSGGVAAGGAAGAGAAGAAAGVTGGSPTGGSAARLAGE